MFQGAYTNTRRKDLDRALRDDFEPEHLWFRLMKVTAATPIAGQDRRWVYSVVEASVTPSGTDYQGSVTTNTATETALSVSEISNGSSASWFAYGVYPPFPGSFDAQQIPVGTYVGCFPLRIQDGTLIWMIVNTQAIDGACTELADLTDGGTYTGEAS